MDAMSDDTNIRRNARHAAPDAPWTEHELAWLREHFQTASAAELREGVRPHHLVHGYRKAKDLGLTWDDGGPNGDLDELAAMVEVSGIPLEQLREIRAMLARGVTRIELQQALEVSERRLIRVMLHLGYCPNPPKRWTEDRDRQLAELFRQGGRDACLPGSGDDIDICKRLVYLGLIKGRDIRLSWELTYVRKAIAARRPMDEMCYALHASPEKVVETAEALGIPEAEVRECPWRSFSWRDIEKLRLQKAQAQLQAG